MKQVRLWGAFTKVVEESDGTLRVEGVASSDTRDTQGETVRPSAIEKAIPGYLRKDGSGPLREMHQPIAAGKTTAIDVQPDGKTYIVTKVVDASTILKVKEKVLQGFSIGGYVPPGGRNKDDPKVIESIVLQEISLVDRPANPDAVVTVFKLDGEPVVKADPPPAPGAQTDAGGAVRQGPNQSTPAGSTPAPPTPPSKAPITPGTTVLPDAPPAVPSPAPPTPAEQPPTTIVPPPNSPTTPSPLPGAPATSPPPSSPPSSPPLPPAKKVAKGMYSISWAAELISGLTSLVSDVTWETNFEGDGSTIPTRLKALCTELVAIFQDLVAEETAELVATMPNVDASAVIAAAEKPGALKKSERLAGIARGFMAAVKGEERQAAVKKAIADLTGKLEAKIADELRNGDAPTAELVKNLNVANEAAAKAGEALKKVLVERDDLKKQLEAANAKLATKGALKVVPVEKGRDGTGVAGDDDDTEKLSAEEQIKKIHAQGGVPYGRAPLT